MPTISVDKAELFRALGKESVSLAPRMLDQTEQALQGKSMEIN